MRRTVRLLVATCCGSELGWGSRPPWQPPRRRATRESSGRFKRSGKSWASPGLRLEPNRAGWDALFDALLNDLRGYGKAADETDRAGGTRPDLSDLGGAGHDGLAAGGESAGGGQGVAAAQVCAGMGYAPAERDGRSPAGRRSTPSVTANRTRWVDFVRNDLGTALREYDAAQTVAKRQAALHRIHESLSTLVRRKPEAAVVALSRARGRGERPVQPAQSRHRRRCQHGLARSSTPTWSRAGPCSAKGMSRR